MGAGNKRTRATKGAASERPLIKAFAAIPGNIMEGNINFRNTKTKAETKTLTHQGHSTSRFSNPIVVTVSRQLAHLGMLR